MKPYTFQRYLAELAIVTLAILLLALILFAWVIPGRMPLILPVYLVFVAALTAAGQVILSRKLKTGNPGSFNSYYLAFKSIKMIAILLFLVGWLLGHKEKSIPFIISAFVIYMVFVAFETRALNRIVRNSGT